MRKVTLLLILISSPFLAKSQTDAEKNDVMSVIFELFDGYRAGDSTRVSATFAPGAQMQRVVNRNGEIMVSPTGSVQGWLDYIGAGLEKKHDEPIWDYTVQIDNGLASVWTKYAFFLEGEFNHCGVDHFLLVQTKGKWKIFHVVDTSQSENCEIPETIRQKSEY